MFRFLLTLTLLCTLLRAQQSSIEVQLQSSFLLVREEAVLTVTVRNMPVNAWPESPVVSPLSLRQKDFTNMIINGRVSKSFSYILSSLRPGTFQIPPFRLGNTVSAPLSVTILPREEIEQGTIILDGKSHPYFSATFIQNKRPFLGETQPIEAKIYLPRDFRVEHRAFADFTKGNFVAWRFDPEQSNSGAIQMNGKIFSSFSYRSSITPLAEGRQTFGPGTARPILNSRVTRRGRIAWLRHQPEVTFPEVDLEVQPLPKPSPTHFSGAVGNFDLTTNVTGSEVTVGDPITVEITVTGTGNLDQLSAPVIMDDQGVFKQFDTSKKPQGRERTSSTGTVEFSQLIRPQKVTPEIPPYALSFFDPVLQKYRTVLSEAIPLTVKPGAATPIAIATSTSEDGPAFLTLSSEIIPAQTRTFPIWIWQIFPGLTALFLIYRKIFPKLREKQAQTAIEKEFSVELATVLEALDRPELYRRASRLIERWPAQADDPDLQKIIATRDEICFSPDQEAETILPKERSAMRDILSRLLPLLLLCAFFTPQLLHAEDWKKIAEESPTPEAFHNLALVEKEAGNKIAAALYLYRYQAYTGDEKPLSDLLSTTGGYRLRKPYKMEFLSILPRSFYTQAGIASLWCLGLSILIILNRKKEWLVLLIPLGLIGATLWGLSLKYYPSEISFKPLTELSVLMEKQKLLKAPFEGADAYSDIPATSPAYLHGVSGDWANVEFPGGLKGWVPRQVMAPIQGRNLWNPPSQKD